MNKFEIVENDSINVNGVVLHRIRALIDFGDVCAGDFGGYIQHEKNLSQSGDAWVYDDAQVYDGAQVYGNARVYGNAQVYGKAQVYGNARVCGNAQVCVDAWVCGDARVSGDARVANKHCIVWFSNVGTEFGTLTVSCGKEELLATRGCFSGTLDDFCEKSAQVHSGQIRREYELLADMARLRLGTAQAEIRKLQQNAAE